MLKFPFNFSHAEISIKVYHKLDPGDVLMVNVEYVYGKQSLLSEQFLFWCGLLVEFNRISVEVLSVVAVQVKSVQDAIRDKKDIFNFMGEMIKCVPTVGIFITMNPVRFH